MPRNPCSQAGSMGKSNAEEMEVWTIEEFNLFLEAVENKPLSYYAFLTLFWTGLRVGELLALTVADRLGHEKIQTTLDTYSHLYPNQNMELADMLDDLDSGNRNNNDGEEDAKDAGTA